MYRRHRKNQLYRSKWEGSFLGDFKERKEGNGDFRFVFGESEEGVEDL